MQQSLIKLIVSLGIFAVLFVYLLFYVLKENSKPFVEASLMVDK